MASRAEACAPPAAGVIVAPAHTPPATSHATTINPYLSLGPVPALLRLGSLVGRDFRVTAALRAGQRG